MNEEEKEAIKELQNTHIFFSEYEAIEDYETENNIKTLLNLIEKQQKEIEELSVIKNSIQTLETHFVNDDTYYVIAKENFLKGDFKHLLDDYISKDKIRKEIEEIKNCRLSTCDEQINKSLNERYEIEDEICEYFEELLGE